MRTETLARHAISVEKAVDGDDPRRMVVDSAKCANCHEWFLGHGGNRVYATDVCVMCHVPNLSSSGRGLAIDLDTNGSDPPNPPNGAARLTGEPASWGVQAGAPNPEDPLTYPEEGQSFKTLIHSIHGSAKRENAFEFVRNRCSNTNSTNCAYYYDFSHVTFPGILNDCSTCHVDATRSTEAGYSVLLPESALPTTVRTTTGADASPADVATARSGANLPNDTDLVTTPVAAACNGCHDSAIAASHMEGHGALIATARSVVVDEIATGEIETCALCHGPGRTVDVELMHAF
jgi:OmcA/MtrC family decaheme c-type cytochrome